MEPQQRPGQPGGKRAQNRQRRLEQIRDAALPLFVEKGLVAVTIDDIVKAAGIAKGSFYRYHRDKAALIEALFAPLCAAFEQALDALEGRLREVRTWEEMVAAYQQLAASLTPILLAHPVELRFYIQESRGPATEARAPIRALARLIRERAVTLTAVAREAKLFRDIPPEVSALAVVGAIEHMIFEYLEGVPLPPVPLLASGLVTMMLEGVREQ